jgi:hypothetical protein
MESTELQQRLAEFSVWSVPRYKKHVKCKYEYSYILTVDLLLSTDPNTWQTRPLVREGGPNGQDNNCQTVTSI